MFLDDCEFHVLKKQVKMLILALKSPKHSNMALSHYTLYHCLNNTILLPEQLHTTTRNMMSSKSMFGSLAERIFSWQKENKQE